MPNWCIGTTIITGEKRNIRNFLDRFLSYDEDNEEKPKKYFARSFITNTIAKEKENLNNELKDYKEKDICEYNLVVDYAWSGYLCLIDNYPQIYKDKCISLKDACIEDKVDVKILTEEPGMCFEEFITCDKKGNINYDYFDMPTYKCKNCGNEQCESRDTDFDELECYECGTIGKDNWKEVL